MIRKLAVLGLVLACVRAGVASENENGWLGVHIEEPDEDDIGVVIAHVIDEQPADGVLEEGDLITAVNGETVLGLQEFVDVIRRTAPGETVRFDLIRDGRARSVSVDLGRRPEAEGGVHLFKSMPGVRGMAISPNNDWDFSFGDVSIEVECEDGDGTIVIEHPGGVETHEFDCSDLGEHKFFMHGLPDMEDMESHIRMHIPDFEFEMDDLDMPRFKKLFKHKGGVVRQFGQPTTRIDVNTDGQIEVTVRKGNDELVLHFEDVDDLRDTRPDLARKYDDLISELEDND